MNDCKPSDAAIAREFWKRWTSTSIHMEAAHELQRIYTDAKATPEAERQVELIDALIDAVAEDAFAGREDQSPETKAARAAAIAALSLPAAQDGVTFLCDGTRFKLCPTKGGAAFFNFPAELAGKWVALVDATDNRHMLPTPNAIRGDKGAEQRYAELAQKWRRRVEARAENINIGPVEAAAIKQCATELEAMNSVGRPHD